MSATDVSVCNGALVQLGADMIVSLEDDSRQAKLCKERYTHIKRKLLRSHPWNFAIRRASLAASVTPPAFGYSNQFPLPINCLRVLEMNQNEIPWEREGNNIVSNSGTCEIRYIEEVDEAYFDNNFQKTLELELAIDLAADLNPTQKQILLAQYQEEIRMARAFDAQESQGGRVRTTTYVNSRR